jgi:hypothetical protein
MKLDQFVMSAMAEVLKPNMQEAKVPGRTPGIIRVPSKAELDTYFKDSLAGGGYDPSSHWCGIFAAYLLRKAGVRCYWLMSKGITDESDGADLEIASDAEARQGLQIGDVLIREPQHHHIIVMEPVTSGVIPCVEGNAGGIAHPLLAMNWAANARNNTVGKVVKRYRIKEKMGAALVGE